jgi:uncharacterized RDD family membrane protein YckC
MAALPALPDDPARRELAEPGRAPAERKQAAGQRVRAAGLLRRVCAGSVDLFLLVTLFVVLQALASLIVGHGLPRLGQLGPAGLLDAVLAGSSGAATGLALFVVLGGTYLVLLNAGAGQTIGKRLFNIRVIDGYGQPLGLGRSLLRALAFVPSLALAGLGVLWIGFDRERRGLHDWLADTYVVLKRDGTREARS